MKSSTSESPRVIRKLIASGFAILALTGCDRSGSLGNSEGPHFYAQGATVGRVAIIKTAGGDLGLNVRYDDEVIQEIGGPDNNQCAEITETTFIKSADGNPMKIVLGIGDDYGKRIGLPLSDMPAPIQEECSRDNDGIVWVLNEPDKVHLDDLQVEVKSQS